MLTLEPRTFSRKFFGVSTDPGGAVALEHLRTVVYRCLFRLPEPKSEQSKKIKQQACTTANTRRFGLQLEIEEPEVVADDCLAELWSPTFVSLFDHWAKGGYRTPAQAPMAPAPAADLSVDFDLTTGKGENELEEPSDAEMQAAELLATQGAEAAVAALLEAQAAKKRKREAKQDRRDRKALAALKARMAASAGPYKYLKS